MFIGGGLNYRRGGEEGGNLNEDLIEKYKFFLIELIQLI